MTSFRPKIFTSLRVSNDARTLSTSTPRMASISARVIGCL